MARPFKKPPEPPSPDHGPATVPLVWRPRVSVNSLLKEEPSRRARLTGLGLFVDICLSGLAFNYVVQKWRDHGMGGYEMTRIAWAFACSDFPEAIALRDALGIDKPVFARKGAPNRSNKLSDLRALVRDRRAVAHDGIAQNPIAPEDQVLPSIPVEGFWMPGWPNWTPAFMVQLGHFPSVAIAAKYAGISYTTARNHMDRTPGFRDAFDATEELALDTAAEVLYQRGVHGFAEETYENGKLVKSVWKVESENLKWMLGKLRPDKYGAKQEIIGTTTGSDQETKMATHMLTIYGEEARKLMAEAGLAIGPPRAADIVDVTPD